MQRFNSSMSPMRWYDVIIRPQTITSSMANVERRRQRLDARTRSSRLINPDVGLGVE
jgi:hypothetical protein